MRRLQESELVVADEVFIPRVSETGTSGNYERVSCLIGSSTEVKENTNMDEIVLESVNS